MANRRWRPHRRHWRSSASTTSPSAAWPSGWRRSGCRARATRWCCARSSEGLYLLQRVRDEAHRFAIRYQRGKRGKRLRGSPLDAVPGLGETRKKALLKHFGSVKKLRAASVEEISQVPGVGRKTAEAVAAALSGAAVGPAVNTATGEIVEDE